MMYSDLARTPCLTSPGGSVVAGTTRLSSLATSDISSVVSSVVTTVVSSDHPTDVSSVVPSDALMHYGGSIGQDI